VCTGYVLLRLGTAGSVWTSSVRSAEELRFALLLHKFQRLMQCFVTVTHHVLPPGRRRPSYHRRVYSLAYICIHKVYIIFSLCVHMSGCKYSEDDKSFASGIM
jgi:hypothetical protein